MNDSDRAALVEELDEAMRRYTGTLLSCTAEAEACLPIINRLLAERHGETTVPDAERVERTAEAIKESWASIESEWKRLRGHEPLWNEMDDIDARDMARAAAGPEADWLDAALEDESFESPLHKAMGSWVTQDFLWRLNNEGEPGHEVAMQHARQAITNFLNAARNATALAAKQEGGER